MLELIGRTRYLFQNDLLNNNNNFEQVTASKFLIIGGAGSIGSAVTKEIFKRNPKCLHIIDINENNLVELVRDLRSSYGYIDGDFRTFAMDFGDRNFEYFMKNEGPYDFVLNLAALKHVRSERDPYTLDRMVKTNVINTIASVKFSEQMKAKKYFAVSSDKAANPANLMGATKRIMELFLFGEQGIDVSMARFANVAFSDGSLLSGFRNRILKNQPLVAPTDVQRYFITPEESGVLCLMSCLCGSDNEVFFPKDFDELKLTRFSQIAVKYLESLGLEPIICETEDEARKFLANGPVKNKWPLYLFESDTTGEKPYEEFFTNSESVDLQRFEDIGVIKNDFKTNQESLKNFINNYKDLQDQPIKSKDEYVELIQSLLSEFCHIETYKNLDQKM